MFGAIAGGQVDEARRARRQKRNIQTKENFVAYTARRSQGVNPAQSEATLVSLSGLSDRWCIGSLSDSQYSEILDNLLAELSVSPRTQSYYAEFVANGSRPELTTERQSRLTISARGEYNIQKFPEES